jgi:predicted O-linked N-acetylglucosamine transferase (SPINDLY family)
VKQKLSANVKTMPLFDTPRYTKYLETAYLTMVARYRNHLPVDHIVIPE